MSMEVRQQCFAEPQAKHAASFCVSRLACPTILNFFKSYFPNPL
jgi:hypothetical protein